MATFPHGPRHEGVVGAAVRVRDHIALSTAGAAALAPWAGLPVALGMAFHVALDVQHERRLRDMRTTAMRRDDFTCQACGVPGRPVTSHVWRQPRLLPSYRMQDVVTLCTSCHEAAHADA